MKQTRTRAVAPWALLLGLATFVVGPGCGFIPQKLTYDLDDIPRSDGPAHPAALAVGRFKDERPQSDWRLGGTSGTGIMRVDVRETIAEHLQRAGVFAQVGVADCDSDPNLEELHALHRKGYGLLLTGTLARHQTEATEGPLGMSAKPDSAGRSPFGFPKMPDSLKLVGIVLPVVYVPWVAFAVVMIPVVAVASVVQPVAHSGYAELADVRLIDTESGSIVWQGQASASATGKHVGGRRVETANEALKHAVDSLASQLRAARLGPEELQRSAQQELGHANAENR